MKSKRFLAILVLLAAATMFDVGPGHAQTAADINRLWCIRMRESLVRNYQAVERMKAEREAGISRLRAEHQAAATRNLDQWYWKKLEDLFKQKNALEAECRAIEIRPDPPGPGRVAPLPQRQEPRPNRPKILRYPPYKRYPEITDPFSSQ